jgi:hypothetical protein
MAMPDEPDKEGQTDAIARKLIAQCRNDIEAAWGQVAAARDALGHTKWLRSRWDAQRRAADAAPEGGTPPDPEAASPQDVRKRSRTRRRRRHRRRS